MLTKKFFGNKERKEKKNNSAKNFKKKKNMPAKDRCFFFEQL